MSDISNDTLDNWEVNFKVTVDQKSFDALAEKLATVDTLCGEDKHLRDKLLAAWGIVRPDGSFANAIIVDGNIADGTLTVKCDHYEVDNVIEYLKTRKIPNDLR